MFCREAKRQGLILKNIETGDYESVNIMRASKRIHAITYSLLYCFRLRCPREKWNIGSTSILCLYAKSIFWIYLTWLEIKSGFEFI